MMIKLKKIFIIILFGISLPAMTQEEWIRIYDEDLDLTARFVIESYDKGFLILGNALNYKYGVIFKADINGNLIWTKLIGQGTYQNIPMNIEQTTDNGYIISGSTSKYDSHDAYILKLNSCFEKEWCKVLYTNNQYPDYGRRVKTLQDGGFLLLTAYYQGVTPGTRIHLHRFSSEGELIWQNVYAQSDSLLFGEEGFDLTLKHLNEYLVTGECYYPDSGQYGGWVRPFIINADSSGSMVWETIWGENDYFYGKTYNSAIDKKGNLYSIGLHIGYDGQYPAMVKTGPDGQELFYSDLVDTAYFGQGQTITFMQDSNLFIALAWKDIDQTPHYGFMKCDTQGIVSGFHEVIPLSNALISTAKTFDNKFITIGTNYDSENNRWVIYAFKLNSDLEYDTIYTAPFVYDSLCPYGITSDTTDLDCDILVLVDEEFVPLNQVNLKIYPNPAADRMTVSYPDISRRAKREIVIYNTHGVKVKRILLLPGDEETSVDVSEFPAGMYYIILSESGRKVTSGKMVKQ